MEPRNRSPSNKPDHSGPFLRKDRRLGQSADHKTLSWPAARDRILEDSIFPKIVGEEWRVPLNWNLETDPLQINPIIRAPFKLDPRNRSPINKPDPSGTFLRKDRRLGQSADAKTLSWSEARDRILEDSNFPKNSWGRVMGPTTDPIPFK